MPKKLIIGLVGEIACGKDTVAAYLKKKYGAETISFSQPLRDILDRIFLPQTRENMAKLGIALRGIFGQDMLSRVIADEVRASKKKIAVLPNVRLQSDIVHLQNEPGFILINVDADIKKRFERIKNRGQNADDKGKTWAEFLKDAKLPTEIQIRKLAKKCKYKLDNNGSQKDLIQQIDKLMKKIKA
ncbi:MAG: AAA family ATPase [Candidatus Buchananbacteria bacterium]|jgi:dephospho-CoA kinase